MSTQRYLQNKVATSSFLLPVAFVLSFLLWFFHGLTSQLNMALGFIICLSCTALMMELNNAFVLLRVRSRMVSATFVLLWASCLSLHGLQWAHVVALCFILIYHSLFHAYQQQSTSGGTFNAFLCLGISSIFVPQVVILAIPLAIAFAWFQAMNSRSFIAMLLGLLTPLWIGGSLGFLTDTLPVMQDYFLSKIEWSFDSYRQVTVPQISLFVWIVILDVISIAHVFRFSYKDKIRTRMFYYFMSWMTWVLVGMVLAFPQYVQVMLILLITNSSPLIAHYFTLANGKVPRAIFVIALLLLFAIITMNLWMPLLNY